MTEINNTETFDFQNAHRDTFKSEPEPYVLMKGEVDEEIKNYIVPLDKHLEDLTQLIQVRAQSHPPH